MSGAEPAEASPRAADRADWEHRYLTHSELTALLHEWHAQVPHLLAVETIGRSPEGREIWLATVHDTAHSPAEAAPALWLDANIHASEVTTSVAALRVIAALIAAEPSSSARRVLERRTLYVVVRQNPDGAERALAPRPALYRSRPHGGRLDASWNGRGLQVTDVDGDGRVLLMRIADRNGWWCRSEHESRLLRPRQPHEDPDQLECFDVLPEGLLAPSGEGGDAAPLDLNRNYPYNWRGEDRQPGAGPAPGSEPEVRAVLDAILARANIGAYLSYHTHSGVHLTPYGDTEQLATADSDRYQALAEVARTLTGYPTEPTLAYWRGGPVYGTSDDWCYDHLGVLAWTTEFWNPLAAAGITRSLPEYWERWREDDELALLAWSDREGDGRCFVDWYRFDHPQLGSVELGGWDQLQAVNPPLRLLPAVLEGHEQFALALALALPELSASLAALSRLGGDIWRLDVAVENIGWLPTTSTERADARGLCAPVTCTVAAGDGVSVIGPATQHLGQLAGAPLPTGVLGDYVFPYGGAGGRRPRRATASFTLRAAPGSTIEVSASHRRAGRTTIRVSLPGAGR